MATFVKGREFTGPVGVKGVRAALEADVRDGKGFRSMADRVRGERVHRQRMADRAISYNVSFLDDALRALMPDDLVLFGAETGIGKTELAQSIGMGAARRGLRVHYFALEAGKLEIEQRTKYKMLCEFAARSGRDLSTVSYADWMLMRCEDVFGDLDEEVEYEMESLSNFHTFYKRDSERFTPERIVQCIDEIHGETDLMVLDHLHYVDVDDDNENRGAKRIIQVCRDVTLSLQKPMIAVVHLRKGDTGPRAKELVPHLDRVHGSSEIVKICTRVVMLARANGQPYHPTLSPTYMAVQKDRVSGSPRAVALCQFDIRRRSYAESYTLGRAKPGSDVFVPLDMQDVPRWARHHVPLIGDPAAKNNPPPPTDADAPPPDEEPQQELYA